MIRLHLHNVNKHFTWIPHSNLKWLSTTGYVFVGSLSLTWLSATAALRAIAATVAIAGGAVWQSRPGAQRCQIGVAGAAVPAVIFQLIRAIRTTAWNKKNPIGKTSRESVDYRQYIYLQSVFGSKKVWFKNKRETYREHRIRTQKKTKWN